jgi:ribosomal protein S8
MPHSKLKVSIAKILKTEGYIADYSTKDLEVGKEHTLVLKFGPNQERAIAGVRRISKPASGSTRSRPTCPRCSAASAWPSCPPPRVC